MNLHTKTQDFRDAAHETAKFLKINEIYIEKDYWITYVLKRLAKSEFAEDVVFKGGTSLSKAFGIVKRFSEDIDLAIVGKENLKGNQVRSKIRRIEKFLMRSPLEEDKSYLHSKHSRIRKTGHLYPKRLISYGDFKNVSVGETLVLELNTFGNPLPNVKKNIETYLAGYLRGFDEKLISEYGLEPFEINVLSLEKTFVEKLLCLARISIDDDDFSGQLERKIRHLYDIHVLSKNLEVQNLLGGELFRKMIREVLDADLSNPDFRESWTVRTLKEVPLFEGLDSIFSNLKNSFENDFKALLYGDEIVSWEEVNTSFKTLAKKIPEIKIRR